LCHGARGLDARLVFRSPQKMKKFWASSCRDGEHVGRNIPARVARHA
jgi:hypothetical protein